MNDYEILLMVFGCFILLLNGVVIGKMLERWDWIMSAHSHHHSQKSNGVWYRVVPHPATEEEVKECHRLDDRYGGRMDDWHNGTMMRNPYYKDKGDK